jgi:hypothetical protein
MAKKVFEMERELAAARVEYHEAHATETGVQLEARSEAIHRMMDDISAAYSKGANERPGEPAVLGIKKGRGLYEVGNGVVRSQGETPDEAVQNWNDEVFVPYSGGGATVTAAVSAE